MERKVLPVKEQITIEQVSSRPIAKFPQDIWENSFASFTFDDSVYESYAKRIDMLKGEVRQRLDGSTDDVIENIKSIDTLCRLGLSYHFEAKIEDKLNRIFRVHGLDGVAAELGGYDLGTVALVFQVLRQYGHKLPSDVFKKFKNKDGKFDESLSSDARAMLSLYEAAQWVTHGEEILDEALEFTKSHLGSLATQTSPHLAKRIEKSVERPYHRGMPKTEIRQYIAYYEKEDDIRDDMLLAFAKLDFNFCQLIYRQELKNIMRWLKDSNLENLGYGRIRPVELFFWSVGICYEPQYSVARNMFTKMVMLNSYYDDTYDAYATADEANLFTDAIEMYPNSEIKLPDYMEFLYDTIHNFYVEAERELAKDGRLQCLSYAVDAFKRLAKGYQQESKWLNSGYVPTVDEYMANGRITSCIAILMAAVLMGMGEAKLDVFEWFSQGPLILRASETITRVRNDVVSREFEKQRKHLPSIVDCYMKQYGASEKDTVDEMEKWITEAWKDTNKGFLESNSIPINILTRFLNNTRAVDVFYTNHDGYTIPEILKNAIISVLFEDIPI